MWAHPKPQPTKLKALMTLQSSNSVTKIQDGSDSVSEDERLRLLMSQ